MPERPSFPSMLRRIAACLALVMAIAGIARPVAAHARMVSVAEGCCAAVPVPVPVPSAATLHGDHSHALRPEGAVIHGAGSKDAPCCQGDAGAPTLALPAARIDLSWPRAVASSWMRTVPPGRAGAQYPPVLRPPRSSPI